VCPLAGKLRVRRVGALYCLRVTERGLSVTAHATPLWYATRQSKALDLGSVPLGNGMLDIVQTRRIRNRNLHARSFLAQVKCQVAPPAHTLRRRTANYMDDGAQDILEAVAAIGRIDVVPTLLKVVCEITGMRFAVVARITDKTWIACAVKDDIHFGLEPGAQFPVDAASCLEALTSRHPLVIEHASIDPLYCRPLAPALHPIESCISAPIILANGRYFGNLSALDPSPAKIGEPRTVSMFEQFAALIAAQLDNQRLRDQEHRALLDERAAGRLREQFIAILGHDLRNPLHAVHAGSDMLERNLTDPALLTIASRLKSNARRMSGLIDDVLDFARGRLGGGIAVELTEIEDLNAGLLTVVQELQDGQPDRQIIADIGVSCPVRCDLGRLQQIASNLLANALTHGLPQSPVKISAKADAHDFVLEVWNAGEPIPAESLDKIFEPFWRHSVSASRNGLGLGLHICSEIVRAHQGRICVTSTRESGTQFTARLPLGIAEKSNPGLGPATQSAEQRPHQAACSATTSTSA
jgi:signal transduction histidine kinase